DCTIVAPGACVGGYCKIGQSCSIGPRAAVKQFLTLGDGALVGMGATVVKSVEPGAVVVGNPARPIQRRPAISMLVGKEATSMSVSARSRVDVIIPCYRYAHFLRDCVKSVTSQEGVDVRVLVIDDASPDETET